MNSLQRRLTNLEIQVPPPTLPAADLSQFTRPELKVLRKLTEHTVRVEHRNPPGNRPLQLLHDRSILTPDEVLIFDGMIQRGTPVESRQ